MSILTQLSLDDALVELSRLLRARGYSFITVTPASHARVLKRRQGAPARNLRDVLGWSLPYAPGSIDREVEALLDEAGLTAARGPLRKATIRVSSLDGQLFAHSAYPTDDENSVFFGPDSYRFAQLIRSHLREHAPPPGAHIVDIGTGAGVGGIVAGLMRRDAWLTLTDINPRALRFARANARAAGIKAEFVEGETLDDVADPIHLAIANPPYIIDAKGRAYRDGGALFGGKVALDMTQIAVERLAPGGQVLLYTGASIVDGRNVLCATIAELADAHGCAYSCDELDPDVFGEELLNEGYEEVDRIAVIAATVRRPL